MISNLFKKVPWWGWLGIFIVFIILWQAISGWAYSRKLFDMALDQLRVDQTKLVRSLEKTITEREMELATVYEKLDKVKHQQAQNRAETEKLKERLREIQARREGVVVSDDPDILVNELHKLGFSTARRRNK